MRLAPAFVVILALGACAPSQQSSVIAAPQPVLTREQRCSADIGNFLGNSNIDDAEKVEAMRMLRDPQVRKNWEANCGK